MMTIDLSSMIAEVSKAVRCQFQTRRGVHQGKQNGQDLNDLNHYITFFDATGPSFFDSLPWIAKLDVAAENVNPWDIANLSQIDVPPRLDAPDNVRCERSEQLYF